jgi:hypothetical protein
MIVFAVIGGLFALGIMYALSQTCLFKHSNGEKDPEWTKASTTDDTDAELHIAQQQPAVGLGDLERRLSIGSEGGEGGDASDSFALVWENSADKGDQSSSAKAGAAGAAEVVVLVSQGAV